MRADYCDSEASWGRGFGGRRSCDLGGSRGGGTTRGSGRNRMHWDKVVKQETGRRVLHSELFMDNTISVGGKLKAKGEVIKHQTDVFGRPPNMNCRIETFSRICQTFDERRTCWVNDMGFGGLLNLANDIHLPRQMGYWLMSRIDPVNKLFIAPDGKQFRLSANQVHWVLGIPNGGYRVPIGKSVSVECLEKVKAIEHKYGQLSKTISRKYAGRVYTSVCIPMNSNLMERLEGVWEAHEEEEFKTLFLLVALEMVLCPTQSPRLASDLFPALTCALNAVSYNWCELVLKRLMDSVASFARRFYSSGVAGGCGGCTIFAVVFYLDKLNRYPVQWGEFPRIKVWDANNIGVAAKEDRLPCAGDYGCLGTLDVAYGELHPKEARDTNGPFVAKQAAGFHFVANNDQRHKAKRRRGATSKFTPYEMKFRKCCGKSIPNGSAKNSNSKLDIKVLSSVRHDFMSSKLKVGGIKGPAHELVAPYDTRCISSEVIHVLQRVVEWFRRLYVMQESQCIWNPFIVDSTVKAEVVVFGGGFQGLGMLECSLDRYFRSHSTDFFALVSEVYSGVGYEAPTMSRVWLLGKIKTPLEACLVCAGDKIPGLQIVTNTDGMTTEVLTMMYKRWFMLIPHQFVTRNIIFSSN